ncbi:hypothetical protein MKD49_08775 [Herbaspirillum sp. WGmk3]|uniref:hypothetical protein n=1 Tax=Herbaspirillum sp. WGmk3 TaxID=2919925 RepID=UPI002090C9E3|nr:hypothetical protein [Herbaspirillum sp. WGmk3]MCO4856573.1 hypothetical protein [Herbaspirillum sp. WGmk3]
MKSRPLLYLFSMFIIVPSTTSASPPHSDLPPINVQGEMKANACLPEERESVRAELPEGSADLVETLLCAKKTEASKNYLLRHMSKFINYTSMDENYVERTQRVKADAALAERLLSAGEAWDVSVEISANRVSITYMPNEACISDRELVRKKGRWMITAIGSACD